MSLIILITSCSKQQNVTDTSNLKPVTGAFGYNLGDKISGEIDDPIIVTDTPPFRMVTIDRTSDGQICRISSFGFIEEFDLHDSSNRLISVLAQKYGSRGKIGSENFNIEVGEGYYFGTTNRVAHLMIDDCQTNALFQLEYYDEGLRGIYNKEQEAKDKTDEENKKAALSKGL